MTMHLGRDPDGGLLTSDLGSRPNGKGDDMQLNHWLGTFFQQNINYCTEQHNPCNATSAHKTEKDITVPFTHHLIRTWQDEILMQEYSWSNQVGIFHNKCSDQFVVSPTWAIRTVRSIHINSGFTFARIAPWIIQHLIFSCDMYVNPREHGRSVVLLLLHLPLNNYNYCSNWELQ